MNVSQQPWCASVQHMAGATQSDRCTRVPDSVDTLKQPVCSEKVSTALFFQYNAQLGPPYQVLVDTNFINFAIKNKVRPRRQSSQQRCAVGACHDITPACLIACAKEVYVRADIGLKSRCDGSV